MAEVWTAEALFESGERHPVAIKRVRGELSQDPLYRSMFEDEARLGMMLRHPNIVRVYHARYVGATYLMIMELVDGVSLKELLDRAMERGAPMPLAAALYVSRGLLRALSYAHRATTPHGQPLGLVHRDVSPHNLLLGRTGDVKLADFGLADANVHKTSLGEGMLGGKLSYLAPEVLEQQPASFKVDLFAAGIVIWEMLAGRRLFSGPDDVSVARAVLSGEVPALSSINTRVPFVVDGFIKKLLARDPNNRFENADAALSELDAVMAKVDSKVSENDIALIVQLHRTTANHGDSQAGAGLRHLEGELADFVAATAGLLVDIGAAPLDPERFR